MAEQKTALKTARSYDLATPRSFRQTPRWQDSVGAPWPPFTPRATESKANQALVRQSYNQGSQTDRGMHKEDAGTQDNLTAGGLPVHTSRPHTSVYTNPHTVVCRPSQPAGGRGCWQTRGLFATSLTVHTFAICLHHARIHPYTHTAVCIHDACTRHGITC